MHLSFHFSHLFGQTGEGIVGKSPTDAPIFMVQNGVVGDLKVEGLKEHVLDDVRSRIEVDLEGFMKTNIDTCVESHTELRVTIEKKIMSMTQSMSLRQHARAISHNERHYPFKFNVQSWLRRDQQERPHHRLMAEMGNNFLSIPPSLRHEITSTPNGMPRPRAGARVTYKLTARLLRDHEVVGRIDQPITLLFSSGPSPPMCLADYKGEYRPCQKASLKGTFLKSLGDLTVDVQEPKQLIVKAGGANSMVDLPVKLRWRMPKQETLPPGHHRIEAEIKWQFRFSTFVSMLEQRAPPTLKQALVSPATAFVRSSLSMREMRMVWRDWRPAYGEDPNAFEGEQNLRLTFPRAEILTPTFWSPFLSRRYSIRLQVKVTSPGTAKFDVEVPIQVGVESALSELYDIDDMSPGTNENFLYEEAEGDELLPQYSR